MNAVPREEGLAEGSLAEEMSASSLQGDEVPAGGAPLAASVSPAARAPVSSPVAGASAAAPAAPLPPDQLSIKTKVFAFTAMCVGFC